MLLERTGTFLGHLLDWGVSETRNGHPQFVAKLRVSSWYNPETGEYESWADCEDQEITAYLCLFTTDQNGQQKELMNAKQLQTTLDWDGQSFESLANGNYGETEVMFRVEENDYNNHVSLQVSWIDKADADPLRQLSKFDAGKLAALSSKYAGAMASSAVTRPPAKAPAKTKSKRAKPKAKTADPTTPPNTTPIPAPGAPSTPSASSDTPVAVETKESAWNAVVEMKAVRITDDRLAEAWVQEVAAIGPDESTFTSTDWVTIKDKVLALTASY